MTLALLPNWDVALLILGAWCCLAALVGLGFGRILRAETPRPEHPQSVSLLAEHRAESELRVRRAMARKAEAERARMEREAA